MFRYNRRRNDSGDSGMTSHSISQAEDDASRYFEIFHL